MTAYLDIERLSISLREEPRTRLLRSVSLAVQPGEVHALVGESGAGKSMMERAIFGILPRAVRIAEGALRLDGRDILSLAEQERRLLAGRSAALIPQDPLTALNPAKRIARQVTQHLVSILGMGEAEARKRAAALLEEALISDPERVMHAYPHELSGGMRQRVLIAAAFATEPRLIVADEPTTALDVTVQRQILRLIHELQHRHGAAVLFVTHNFGLVAKLCQSVTVLYAGRVVEDGATREVLAAPRHPYTAALLKATPRLDRPAEALAPLPRSLIETLLAEAYAYDVANAGAYR